MKHALAMKFVMMRADAERKHAQAPEIGEEHVFLALLKLAEIKAEDFYEGPEALLSAANQDIAAVQSIMAKNQINTARTRAQLREMVSGKTHISDQLLKERVAAAEKLSEKENSERLTAKNMLLSILDDPSDMILQVCPIKKNSAKPNQNSEMGISALPELTARIRSMRAQLLSTVFGQDHVVHAFAEGLFAAEVLAASDEKRVRPRAIFAFVGPPGVGKTFLAEKAAEYLGLPFKRFDMSGFSDHQAHSALIGWEKSYKGAGEGTLTGFVKQNPHCILLFDEIEKAHVNTINLFLQVLDAGRLNDKYLDEDISFKDTIIIFTSNAGKSLYESATPGSAAGVPRNVILDALRTEIDPRTREPFFPAAITSRLATGWPMLFNHLQAQTLETIIETELERMGGLFEKQYGIKPIFDNAVANVLLMAEGGLPDARTLRAQAELFFKNEIYKVCRLWGEKHFAEALKKLKQISFRVETSDLPDQLASSFGSTSSTEVLCFADEYTAKICKKELKDFSVYSAENAEEALVLAGEKDIQLVIIDPSKQEIDINNKSIGQSIAEKKENRSGHGTIAFDYSSITDASMTEAYQLFRGLRARLPEIPVYLLETVEHEIDPEMEISFVRAGARGKVSIDIDDPSLFADQMKELAQELHLQRAAAQLAAEHKILSFETYPKIRESGKEVCITIGNFSMKRSVSGDDMTAVVDEVEKPKVRFADVIGASAAKDELQFFVDYLKNPKKFTARGIKPPKGILLYGPPGTGKTMLAKAMAGESDVAFIPAVASSFVTIWQGSGPQAIRDLFKRARRYAPSIIFIDEIDAIGRQRGQSINGHAEEMTLNALLTEMDGFSVDPKRPVFVLAATNFDVEKGQGGPGIIDDALSRRFDRKILVDLPNEDDRKKFLQILLNKIQGNKVSEKMINQVASRSIGRSPSWLTSMVDMANRSSMKKGVALDDALLDETFETMTYGEEKDFGIDYQTKVARHECGHALISYLNGSAPAYLTIVSRGDHGGYMEYAADVRNAPEYTKEDLEGRIRVALGGRAAEIVYYGETEGVTTGASSDLRSATITAANMLCSYGMDDEYGLCAMSIPKDYSPEMRKRINEILNRELQKTIDLIKENRDRMDKLVSLLLKKNKLSSEEIKHCLG